MEIPGELLRGLDELTRTDFQDLRDWYFRGLLISSALVFIGVLMEAPELLHETRRWVGDLRPPKLILDSASGLPLTAPHTSHSLMRIASLVGWLFVLIGVIGEGAFEGYVSRADALLQSFDSTLLAQTQAETATALERAATADLRAAELEADIQPRDLSKSSQEQIRKALEHNKVKVRIVAYAGDAEGSRLAQELAGVIGTKDAIFEVPFSGLGMMYGAKVCRLSPSPDVARVIAAALSASMVVDLQSASPENCVPDILRVFVGMKPLPSDQQKRPVAPSAKLSRSLDENIQLRIARGLPRFRGVVTITYLEAIPDSPELAGQMYRILDKAVHKGVVYRDPFDLPSDPTGIEVRHTPDSEATSFAESVASALEGKIRGVRVFSGLKMPFDTLPLNDPARSRVVIRIGKNP